MSTKYGSIERKDVPPRDFIACLQLVQECRKIRRLAYQCRHLNVVSEKEFATIVTQATNTEAETQLRILNYALKGVYDTGEASEHKAE